VRAQLTALERDGLVRKSGVRRGLRKPQQEYELTPEVEHLFPKPYASVLCELLATLKERLPPETLEEALRQVGTRLAAGRPTSAGREAGLERRVQEAAAILGDLGGLPQMERSNGGFVIRSASCPLAAVSAASPRGLPTRPSARRPSGRRAGARTLRPRAITPVLFRDRCERALKRHKPAPCGRRSV
jgi:predicted ArsR family transcriptional regulator